MFITQSAAFSVKLVKYTCKLRKKINALLSLYFLSVLFASLKVKKALLKLKAFEKNRNSGLIAKKGQ